MEINHSFPKTSALSLKGAINQKFYEMKLMRVYGRFLPWMYQGQEIQCSTKCGHFVAVDDEPQPTSILPAIQVQQEAENLVQIEVIRCWFVGKPEPLESVTLQVFLCLTKFRKKFGQTSSELLQKPRRPQKDTEVLLNPQIPLSETHNAHEPLLFCSNQHLKWTRWTRPWELLSLLPKKLPATPHGGTGPWFRSPYRR